MLGAERYIPTDKPPNARASMATPGESGTNTAHHIEDMEEEKGIEVPMEADSPIL